MDEGSLYGINDLLIETKSITCTLIGVRGMILHVI